jgi:hypothetical protein
MRSSPKKNLAVRQGFLGEGSTPAAHFSCRQESSAHDEQFDGDSIPFPFSFSMAAELKSRRSNALDRQIGAGYLSARFKAMEFALTAGCLQPS